MRKFPSRFKILLLLNPLFFIRVQAQWFINKQFTPRLIGSWNLECWLFILFGIWEAKFALAVRCYSHNWEITKKGKCTYIFKKREWLSSHICFFL